MEMENGKWQLALVFPATTETHLKLEKLANNYVSETLKNAQMLPPPTSRLAHVTFSQTKRKLLIFRKRFERRQQKRRGARGKTLFLTRTFHF